MAGLASQTLPFHDVPGGHEAHELRACWKNPALQVQETPLKYELVGHEGITGLAGTHEPA